jgi:hypothetical protein
MSHNPFTSIDLKLDFGQGHLVSWTIDPLFEDEEPHKFVIEVSESPLFETILREHVIGNLPFGRDTKGLHQNFNNIIYYRVRLDTPNKSYYSDVIDTNFAPLSRRQYAIANEIIRKELMLMTKFTGINISVLKRKIYGPSIEDKTVDPITGVALTDEAPNHGNEKTKGYYDQIHSWMSNAGGQSINRLDPSGTGSVNRFIQQVRMLPFPIVNYNDIVIDVDSDLRYIVKEVDMVTYPGTSIILVQNVQLSLLPTSDPVYLININ